MGRIPRVASNWTYALHMYTYTHTAHTCTHTHMCTVRLKVWYHFRYFLSLYEQTTGITEIHVYNTHTWYSYTCDNDSGNKTLILHSPNDCYDSVSLLVTYPPHPPSTFSLFDHSTAKHHNLVEWCGNFTQPQSQIYHTRKMGKINQQN